MAHPPSSTGGEESTGTPGGDPGPKTSARRALAHPLRSRLLAELRIHGEATASDLARALTTNTGASSYHLRRLAEVGLVQDTGAGVGRRRLWRAAPQDGFTPRPAPADDEEAAVEDWLARDYLDHFHSRATSLLDAQGHWPSAWRDNLGLEDHLTLVSAEQLSAMRAEMLEVMARYRRLGQGNPQAKRVVVYTCALPVDGPPPPGEGI